MNMRNRLKKSLRQHSVSSTQPSRLAADERDSSHVRTASAPDDSSAATSLTYAPDALANPQAMGFTSRGSNRADKSKPPSASVPAMTVAAARSSPSPVLSPASSSHLNGGPTAVGLSRTLSTIRTVTSFDDKPRPSFDDEASSVGSPSLTRHSNSAFSSSVNSNVSTASCTSQSPRSPPANDSTKPSTLPDSPSRLARTNSNNNRVPGAYGAFGTTTTARVPSGSAPLPPLPTTAMADDGSSSGAAGAAPAAWDSTVGKAGLGKTGRVINKLVSDNEALKRDLKIERLKADEARQAARLLEDKMERATADYESRLLEASVTKTLLARKERQVETLQDAVGREKARAVAALERESTWRDEAERARASAQRQVDDASSHAALMEGRYNAISSHWRDQGVEVRRTADRMGADIRALAAARRDDDDKITILRDLCDQQDANIRHLCAQKDAIARQFAAYKEEQERLLHDIKASAAAREAEQERTLEEARNVLDKLKWALNVKSTIEWAT